MCETQNMTVGVSFGEARQAAFEWAGTRERCSGGGTFPEHLLSPPVHPGSHKNVVLGLTLPDSSTYTFGRDVNLLWKHGILAEKAPTGQRGAQLNVEEGRISIIAWGWVDQYDVSDLSSVYTVQMVVSAGQLTQRFQMRRDNFTGAGWVPRRSARPRPRPP
eukprot:SAG11_NODE_117_length_15962_cov_71.527925_12_plen_161_part_00